MPHRVNVMLDNQAWEIISSIPRGRRSRFISRAVVEAATLENRRRTAEQLAALREQMAPPPASAEDMIRELRDSA